jgi:hypothetical protein
MKAAGEDDDAYGDVCNSAAFMITDTMKTTRNKDSCSIVIAACIRSFINTAHSRDFDCVRLRNDGEGALAAMSEELSGLAIMLDAYLVSMYP